MLSGRRVVITGAGRGLGRAFAIAAGDEGAELARSAPRHR
jgi:NAD(P)-dependent dehydrogenase (short-subunit alcohol dehydrogenase family)